MKIIPLLLALLLPLFTLPVLACQEAGELCKPGVECCANLACTPRVGQGSICAASSGTTVPTVTPTTKPPVVPTTVPTTTPTTAPKGCSQAGKLCGLNHDPCCAPLACVANHCAAGATGTTVPVTGTTVPVGTPTTAPRPVTSTTLLPAPISGGVDPVRPTYGDMGEALRGGQGQFYVWYRGRLADQPTRDAMQQYLSGVVLPELDRVLRGDCPSVIPKMNVVYRRLANQYENLADIWSIGPQGRNYSVDVDALGTFQACLLKKPENPKVTMAIRDATDLRVVDGRYAKKDPTIGFPKPPPNETIGKLAPLDARLSFPPVDAGDRAALHGAHTAHAIASIGGCGSNTLGSFPLTTDAAHQAWERGCVKYPVAQRRACLHYRQIKRFSGYCDSTQNGNPKGWTPEECCKWKAIQDKFHGVGPDSWTANEEKGDQRGARNADSDHWLSHLCANVKDDALEVRFSIPGVDEHKWPIENCVTALARLAP